MPDPARAILEALVIPVTRTAGELATPRVVKELSWTIGAHVGEPLPPASCKPVRVTSKRLCEMVVVHVIPEPLVERETSALVESVCETVFVVSKCKGVWVQFVAPGLA